MIEFSAFLDEKTGRSFVVTSDLERLAGDMKTMAPKDTEIIDEFFSACTKALRGILGGPKPELMELIQRYNISVAAFAQRFKNPQLHWYITNLCLPEMPVYSMFMILGLFAEGHLGLLEGGSLKPSHAIAERHQELGGEVSYGACVEEIIVETTVQRASVSLTAPCTGPM